MNAPLMTHELASEVRHVAEHAGRDIMTIYRRDFAVYEKTDESPVTEADLLAHRLIVKRLAELSDWPILSEESSSIDWQERQTWQTYWLVDPLDGTKEFIKKNDEFTVNIALIHQGKPLFGVVHAPALGTTYEGWVGQYAEKMTSTERSQLATKPRRPGETWRVVGSRSHQSEAIQALLGQLDGDTELVAVGSSLKLCMVAEGSAHWYPRLGPTSEWDTAAAHAVVLAAGGKVTVLDEQDPFAADAKALVYNQKDSLLNPYFLVSS